MSNISASEAIAHSYLNRIEVLNSDLCGCFYCCELVPKKGLLWTDCNDPDEEEPGAVRPDRGETAVCPICDNSSIIGSASGFEITDELLQAMRQHWSKSAGG
jgi:hypothetical protein